MTTGIPDIMRILNNDEVMAVVERNKQADFLFNVKAEDINVLYCAKSGDDCKWRKDRQKHWFFEWIYSLNAQAEVELPDRVVKLNPNEMILYPPNVTHKEIPNVKHTQQIISMGISVDCDIEFETGILISDTEGILGWLFENCYKEYTQKKDGHMQLIQGFVKAIYIYTGRYISNKSFLSGNLFSQCSDYIKKNYRENLSIALLESVFCVSGSYISRMFSKKYGMGPMQYMNYCRINEAKKLLANDKNTIAMISSKVGFKDPLYFSRVFLKQEGVSPTEYRKRMLMD